MEDTMPLTQEELAHVAHAVENAGKLLDLGAPPEHAALPFRHLQQWAAEQCVKSGEPRWQLTQMAAELLRGFVADHAPENMRPVPAGAWRRRRAYRAD